MNTPFSYSEIQLSADGFLRSDAGIDAVRQSLPIGTTDLLVLAHGWDETADEARALYAALTAQCRAILESGAVNLGSRRITVLGVLWPSKQFGVPNSEDQPDVARIRETLDPGSQDPDDATTEFFALNQKELVERLSLPLAAPLPHQAPDVSPAAGLAGGLQHGVANLLNFTTYYVMKDRAGKAGRNGLRPTLEAVHARRPYLRFHLAGHSFGGRLVTAAAQAPGQARPATLHLLQAAFSHNGFASRYDGLHDGAFRDVVARRRVAGPILITHTHNDKALTWAYEIASRLAGQQASGFNGASDLYGGMGANGAQHTPERVAGQMQPVGGPYSFTGESVPYNLHAGDFIRGHSDIAKPEVAYAILSALGLRSKIKN